ncbi:hypothetical protein MACH16_20110 [Marinomonas pontica]|uniref:Cupin domain-containing protein n=1 Tax=Marinomonas pontica TaxID=264739 RepID=A0ABM8FGX5_9GAMM|nr:hypothetical protein [Marinomonas pontica]MCW8357309.1 hypothetical protein [Marinomonas pontica]BDX03263.1 hypothetical protein MACH16_20110 [Marinomonas pontica]
MVNVSDQNILDPLDYDLGAPSKHLIIHQQDDLRIAHEHLFQSATPVRFYHYPANTFLFVMKGELYLQHHQQDTESPSQETALKKHQGIWLAANSINCVNLLSASAEVCLVQFSPLHDLSDTPPPFKKMSSGSVESQTGRGQIKTWPLWEGESGQICLELYPPQYKETLYYHKKATQYFLPLNGTAFLSDKTKQTEVCPIFGKIIPHKQPRAVINPNKDSITMLSVMTPQSTKGRVLLLTRST